jgi:hypothetical protein
MPSYSSQADGSFIIKEGDKEVRFVTPHFQGCGSLW